jgi:4-amino-4-deoxy-L-arabinose transferase-like glycosyltransferase
MRTTLYGLLLVGLAFRILFIADDMRTLVTLGPLYDDSFYSFEIARNIARGLGSTFDGVQPTNGYQPLYVFLLVPIYWASGDHATIPIYFALAASAICNVLTGWILFRLVKGWASTAAAFFGLVLWSFGPAIVRQAVNGLETALAMLCIAAALDYYVRVYRAAASPSRRQAVTLGALLGLAVFARIDAVLFVAALVADAAWRSRHRRGELRALALAAAVAAAVLLPWCIGSQALFGTVLPESGSATRFLSEAYAPRDHPGITPASFTGGPPPSFLADNLSQSFLQIGTSPVLHVFTRAIERALQALHFPAAATVYAVGSFLCLALVGVFFLVRRRRTARVDLRFLFVYAVLLVAAYSLVVFGQIFYSRYYYPIFFLSIILGAIAFDLLLQMLRSAERRRNVAIACSVVYAALLAHMSMHRVQNGNYRFLHVVDWIATHTPPDATIGVFNSGAIGYFSDRRVINLDGKVNPAALEALRRGDIGDYIESQGIDYVIDHEWILGRFLSVPASAADGVALTRVDGDAAVGVPGWAAYRVESGAATAGGSGAAAAPASRLRH